MTGIFIKKAPGNFVLLLILGLLLKFPELVDLRPPAAMPQDAVLYTGLLELLEGSGQRHPQLYAGLVLLIHLLTAFMLTGFINNGRLMPKANYLSGMAYLLISSLIPGFDLLSSTLVASVFLLAACILLYNAHGGKPARGAIFNAGLMIGIASLFHLPALFFLFWALLALALLRPFQLSEWILLVLAALLPYYFYAAALFLAGQWQLPPYLQEPLMIIHKIQFTRWQGGAILLLLIPLFTGLYFVHAHTAKMLVHIRKMWYLLLWYLAICFGISFFRIVPSVENWVCMLVPIAAFHGYAYFHVPRKPPFALIYFWLTVAFIIALHYR